METIKLNTPRMNAVTLITLSDVVAGKLAPVLPATPPVPNMGAKVISLNAVETALTTANNTYVA